jgi:hypothetical protein
MGSRLGIASPTINSRNMIGTHRCPLLTQLLVAVILIGLSACAATPQMAGSGQPSASPAEPSSTTPPPSVTPKPPTDTPLPPTETATLAPFATPTPTETPTPSDTPTETVPPPTASGDEAIYVYYIQLNTDGPLSCGDSLVKVNTGVYRSGDVASDVATALQRLFSKQQYIGNLYNPVYLSNWRIDSVEFKSFSGLVNVSFSGAYVRSGDRCDDSRVRAQIWSTIRQFPGVKTVYILMNGNLLGDILATGK